MHRRMSMRWAACCNELLSGRTPFVADGPGRLIGMHLFQEPPPLRSVAPQVPSGDCRACASDAAEGKDAATYDEGSSGELAKQVAKQTGMPIAASLPSPTDAEEASSAARITGQHDGSVDRSAMPKPARASLEPVGGRSAGHGSGRCGVAGFSTRAEVNCNIVSYEFEPHRRHRSRHRPRPIWGQDRRRPETATSDLSKPSEMVSAPKQKAPPSSRSRRAFRRRDPLKESLRGRNGLI